MITVLLVDDDPMVRTGLRLIIGGDSSIDIVGEASDGVQALEMIDSTGPDVVLLDIRMPVLDGLRVLQRLSGRDGPPAVIVLTTFHADDYVLRALREGARGFLLKDADPAEIVSAITSVQRGEHALSPAVTATVIDAAAANRPAVDPALQRAVAELTDREREVAVLMAQGLSNQEIGQRLYLSLATVKANLTRVFTKLGSDNRVSAAMQIRDAGLLDQER
ncbi:response regulator [Microlunatus soli]|uniref:DNA-binding response regulator, NarL/FixJ family, contains REC and HTH domains n=1 Tax=Microlunatus soli TaxID=630515 RepID=A0A1H1MQI3_9ACTN|nr:response regulator transcription factor [Microlunatus soli]SDR89123.1 DNA-binding response regulator, NarL/FixJ family, contains REC and HTH domains [Microlunatus soli]